MRARRLIRARLPHLAGAATLIAAVLVPVGAVGASTGCDAVSNLLGTCVPTAPPTVQLTDSTCGGEQPAKADGTSWVCTFDDEFTGSALDRSAWTVETTDATGFHSGPECVVDSPDNIWVTGGHLNLAVRKIAAPTTCGQRADRLTTSYTGASVYTGAFAQQYGRFEVRARFAETGGAPGVQGSLWLFPTSQTVSGLVAGASEIDIAEAYAHYPDIVVPNVHGYTRLPGSSADCKVPDYGAAFHTYTAIWTPSTISFVYDGATCLQVSAPAGVPLSARPFLVALSETLGVRNNSVTPATPLPAVEQVDYVRVWS